MLNLFFLLILRLLSLIRKVSKIQPFRAVAYSGYSPGGGLKYLAKGQAFVWVKPPPPCIAKANLKQWLFSEN